MQLDPRGLSSPRGSGVRFVKGQGTWYTRRGPCIRVPSLAVAALKPGERGGKATLARRLRRCYPPSSRMKVSASIAMKANAGKTRTRNSPSPIGHQPPHHSRRGRISGRNLGRKRGRIGPLPLIPLIPRISFTSSLVVIARRSGKGPARGPIGGFTTYQGIPGPAMALLCLTAWGSLSSIKPGSERFLAPVCGRLLKTV